MKLYEISQALIDLATAYEQGDIPGEAYKDTLQGMEMEFADKAEQIAKFIRNLETDNLVLQAEIGRLQDKMAANNNQVKRLKEYLLEQFKLSGKDKLVTPLFKFTVCKNGGELPIQIIGVVPDEYKKLVEDNAKIREALKNGKTLDFAVFGERGEHLKIR